MKPVATKCSNCGMVAVEVVCHVCKAPREDWDALNRYVEAGIRREQRERLEGLADAPGYAPDGRAIKPGS